MQMSNAKALPQGAQQHFKATVACDANSLQPGRAVCLQPELLEAQT
jgi:hypothetical protein